MREVSREGTRGCKSLTAAHLLSVFAPIPLSSPKKVVACRLESLEKAAEIVWITVFIVSPWGKYSVADYRFSYGASRLV